MLALSLVLGVLSAVAYGGSTAVQHGEAHTGGGEADARGLVALLRSVRWWLSVGGDGVGLVLQVAALSTGAVVLVQPLQVLSLPVALPLRARLGGAAPTGRDWTAVVAVVAGLGGFLVLVGDPGPPAPLAAPAVLWLSGVALAVAAVAVGLSRPLRPAARAALVGAAGGALFAVVAVLIDVTSRLAEDRGVGALVHGRGLAAVAGVVVVGAAAMTVVQLSFQLGGLGASFPATLVVDPVVAVVLGAALLHERFPLDGPHLLGYLVAIGVVVAATIVLANPRPAPAPAAPPRKDGAPTP